MAAKSSPTATVTSGGAGVTVWRMAKAWDGDLHWTGEDEADELISRDPMALLIGFCLDQQFPVERAFLGPLLIKDRIGSLDPARLAAVAPDRMEAAFRKVPAVHRYPASMAQRVQGLCEAVVRDYQGDPRGIWESAADGSDLRKRIRALPGFGEAKSRILIGVLGNHFGVRPRGWEAEAPDFPSLAQVRTVEERERYQAGKRAAKAAAREAAAGTPVRARRR